MEPSFSWNIIFSNGKKPTNEVLMKKSLLAIAILVLLISACTPKAPSRSIRLPVGFIPNIQFAPLYVAIDKGFFKSENLDVQLDYSMEADNVALVGAGQISFAIVSGEQVLLGRAQGLPIVYAMVWYQKYPVAIASLKSANITNPADLKGKKIGIPMLSGASYIGMEAILKAAKLTDQDVTLDTIGFTQVESLIAGLDDAVVVYSNNEPIQLESRGYPVNVINVSDYLPMVGNGLLTNEITLSQDPALVRDMVAAILQGIQFTMDYPDEAYTISMKYIQNLQANDPIQKNILTASIDLWKANPLGFSQASAWSNMESILKTTGLIKTNLDVNQAYTNQFLP
jgi:NitT/TauT family transport system substrate-binding protein